MAEGHAQDPGSPPARRLRAVLQCLPAKTGNKLVELRSHSVWAVRLMAFHPPEGSLTMGKKEDQVRHILRVPNWHSSGAESAANRVVNPL
jgi:hypothetical protein